LDTNVKGLLFALKHQVPALIGHGGAIVNVSSIVVPSAWRAPRSTRQASTQSTDLHARLRWKWRARACASMGGPWVYRHADAGALHTGGNKEVQSGLAGAHPVGRLGGVEEIAQAILYLASDDAKFITGSVLAIRRRLHAQ